MPKKMTLSEQAVGRRLPPLPKYADTIMAGFVKADGTFCGRMEPGDRWLRSAWAKIRRAGWVKSSGLGFGKNMAICFLTERGEAEAVAAKERVDAANEARAVWARDWRESYGYGMEAA